MKITIHLKTVYLHPTLENLEILIQYFENIAGKPLSVNIRRQYAFKTKWIIREENLRSRCHIQNAVEYLQSIKSNFTNEQIHIVIADIAKYVNILDSNEDISFIVLSTNTLPSAIHFNTAEALFKKHQIENQNQNNYGVDLLMIYALRISLESRIRGFLGIDYATMNGKPTGLNVLIKVSKNLKLVRFSKAVNWDEIGWINDWINHHVHRLIRPYPWIIFQALKSLQPFLSPKDSMKIGTRTRYSIYSATLVDNEEDFHEEIEKSLKDENPLIEVHWNDKKDILLTKKKGIL